MAKEIKFEMDARDQLRNKQGASLTPENIGETLRKIAELLKTGA